MIKNDREYQVTKGQTQKFEQTLNGLLKDSNNTKTHPLLLQAQINSLKSQITELDKEIAEYEELFSYKLDFQVQSIIDLPITLIKARIALKMSLKELASKIGIKEEALQECENNYYIEASIKELLEIAKFLNVQIIDEIPSNIPTFNQLLTRLKEIGFSPQFTIHSLLPPKISAWIQTFGKKVKYTTDFTVLQVATNICRIFDWSPSIIFGENPLSFNQTIIAGARFKTGKLVNFQHLNVYTIYAHYLSLLVLKATPKLTSKKLPNSSNEIRETIIAQYNQISLESALKYVWAMGIPVIPLKNSGAFHGACWRINSRNIIVLKQNTKSKARWLFDLFHEFGHLSQNSKEKDLTVIELNEMERARLQSQEEINASQFAGEIILNNQAEELTEICIKKANGNIKFLKNAVIDVAQQNNIPVGSLANYLAFRLSLQGFNWWGAVNNLQNTNENPYMITRDVLLKNLDLEVLSEDERNILIQAISEY